MTAGDVFWRLSDISAVPPYRCAGVSALQNGITQRAALLDHAIVGGLAHRVTLYEIPDGAAQRIIGVGKARLCHCRQSRDGLAIQALRNG